MFERVRVNRFNMLLVDPSDFSVYRVSKTALVNVEATEIHAPMPFDVFEKAARTSYSSLIMETARYPTFRLRTKAIVFVRLKNGKGFAWASPLSVEHNRQYPTAASETVLGKDMLLLWPVPMAINAYINFKERARVDSAAGLHALSTSAVLSHPPALQTRAHRCPDDFELEGKIAPRDLTLAQRLFIASLAPNLPAFALRQSPDTWCSRLVESDESNFAQIFASVSDQWRMKPVTASEAFPAALVARLEARKVPKRERGRRVALDLPDELVSRIACMRISEDMSGIRQMCHAVARLGGISHQFRACTHEVLQRMLARVQGCVHWLEDPVRCDARRVQQVLWASGLSLRWAFRLSAASFVRGCPYIHARNKLVPHELDKGQPSAAQRRAILWDA